MITLYDLEFTVPGKTISPYVMKVRLALNVKKLPHRTVWIKDYELQERAAELGLPMNYINDGPPRYRVPVIHDPSTDTKVSDSAQIIAYLDKTYPDTPTLMPKGTEAAAVALDDAVLANMIGPLSPSIAPRMGLWMDERSKAVFKPKVAAIIGMEFEEFFEKPEFERAVWEKAAEGYSVVDRIFEKAGLVKGGQPDYHREGSFTTGDNITYGDLSAGSAVIWAKRVLGDHEEPWEALKGWNGGRWLKLYEALQPYLVVHD